jgi:hypothetical protein
MTNTLRIAGSAVILFLAAFLLGQGLLGQGLFAVRPLHPGALLPTLPHTDGPDRSLDPSAVSGTDRARDRLRHEVLDQAKALDDDPCSAPLKTHYVRAVVDYMRAWFSIAPCLRTHDCGAGDSQVVDRAERAFGSPLDLRVRDAMRTVHAKVMLRADDFPQDTIDLVSQLAGDNLANPDADGGVRRTANVRQRAGCAGRSR